MKETNYSTVLSRIFIRAKIGEKWDSYSLEEMLGHDSELWDWLKRFSRGAIAGEPPIVPISKSDLIGIIKQFDRLGIPPVRIKESKLTKKRKTK